MDKQEIFARVAILLAEYLDVDISRISLSTSLRHDLNIDSLEYIDIVLRCEALFDIKIAPIEMEYLYTVDDVVKCILVKIINKNDHEQP